MITEKPGLCRWKPRHGKAYKDKIYTFTIGIPAYSVGY